MAAEPAADTTWLKLCPDAVLRRADGAWVVTNPRTHTHVELDATAMKVVAEHGDGATVAEWAAALNGAQGFDRSAFDFTYGLWSDPSRFASRQGNAAAGADLVALLHRQWMLCANDGGDYKQFLAALDSILDRNHLGTFHQRTGQHLAVVLRLRDKWRWWHDSKFTPDGLQLKPGPYKWIQETFFDRYFAAEPVKGTRVLDFACGNGYYARKFAALGASVLGTDTDANLIRMAEANNRGDCRFTAPADPKASLDAIRAMEAASFDRVYMSDIVLLLDGDESETGALATMKALAHVLRPGGRLHMCEPNPIFWLGCRLGTAEAPMVVASEYRSPVYSVAPTLDRVMATMAKAGFALVEFRHPGGEAVPAEAAALRAFTRDFPTWDFLTFERRPV
ncbi:MAG TPA: class I SAM-dependent methyltransferase [Magnetospirillaceae bacterium]|jgi:SAM-dependent methyltransferase